MKTAIVTGANRGLGFLVSQHLANDGFHVVVGSRSRKAGEDAVAKLKAANPSASAETRELDMSSLASVRAFASAWSGPVSVLVNNAGTMTAPGEHMHKSGDGLESTIATNHFGPALLSLLMFEKLRASAPARIVNVASRSIMGFPGMGGPAQWDWDNVNGEKSFAAVEAYKSSKLALTWFSAELARRAQDKSVTVNAVCPGFVPETAGENVKGFQKFMFQHVLTHVPGAHTAAEASANIAWAVTDPALGDVTGKYFGERKPIDVSSVAGNIGDAKRMWDLTLKTVGVDAGTLAKLGL